MLSSCKDKNQRRQNKEILRSVCVGRRKTSHGIMFFNMQAKQGQTNTGMLKVMKDTEQSGEVKKKQRERKLTHVNNPATPK